MTKQPSTSKILFIMGNGPSLKPIMYERLDDLRSFHTFGLNAAYRAYDELNFFPTYFGCFDFVVNNSHKEAFESLVLRKDASIQKFFFIGNQRERQNMYAPTVRKHRKFHNFEFKMAAPRLSPSLKCIFNAGASGANAAQLGILMGYKMIVLLGCDCNYVEIVDGVTGTPNSAKLSVEKPIDDNPNYWLQGYQRVGDQFNLPQGKTIQMNSWRALHDMCPRDVTIVNASSISQIPFFPKVSLDSVLESSALRRLPSVPIRCLPAPKERKKQSTRPVVTRCGRRRVR